MTLKDKALDEIDKEEETKKETSSSEYETDEEWEMERKKHLAGQEKERVCYKYSYVWMCQDFIDCVQALYFVTFLFWIFLCRGGSP